ncbi:TonB-dependent siderophore receptor [Roseicella frigidaeris]|uniref:TonB-dependent siderophore receptor n=1 Tax=Roseicella frigidaeris TaxID=2230885 RepID=A0A327MDD4_9PROT|nr:TonB-dependent siderophore receptor [Roseicella frigidaeris]
MLCRGGGRFQPINVLPGLLLLSGVTLSGQALAQAEPDAAGSSRPVDVRLPEVDVTGQAETGRGPVAGYVARTSTAGTKTDTPVLETPQSLSIITRDQMDQQNVQTLNGAVRYTPGVTPETRGGIATRYDMLKVRGFDADTYWNGMKLIGNGWYGVPQLDPFLMERIEVLRGPVSVLYGQAAAGGLLNQESKRPTLEPLRQIGLQFGNFEHARGTIDLSGPLDADRRFLYRITAIGRTEQGQIETTRNQRLAIAPSFTWRPDDDTTLTLLGLYQHDPRNTSYGAVPPVGTVLSNPYGRLNYRFYDGDPNFEKFDRTQASLGYEFDRRLGADWSVRATGRWFHIDQDYKSVYSSFLQPDDRTLSRGTAYSTDQLNTYTLDNQLQGRFVTGPLSHTVLAGFDYQHLNSAYRTGFGAAPTLDLFAPTYYQPIVAPDRYRVRIDGNQYGLYAQDQIRLGKFVLTLGGRQDWFDTLTRNLTFETRAKQSDSAFTGRVGLTYVFDSGIAPYVSYSESFTPQNGTDINGKPFDPERGHQYEIGIKYQPRSFDALFTLALFELTRQNLLTTDLTNPNFQSQSGEARSRGVELESRVSLTERLNVVASYTYLDTTYTKDSSGLQGKYLAAVPQHQASGWAYYTFGEGPLSGLSAGGGGRYTGSTYSADNSFKVRNFFLVDATIRYDLGRQIPKLQGAQLYVNAQNLLDKHYVASCYYGTWCAYGYGRQVFAGLTYRW